MTFSWMVFECFSVEESWIYHWRSIGSLVTWCWCFKFGSFRWYRFRSLLFKFFKQTRLFVIKINFRSSLQIILGRSPYWCSMVHCFCIFLCIGCIWLCCYLRRGDIFWLVSGGFWGCFRNFIRLESICIEFLVLG